MTITASDKTQARADWDAAASGWSSHAPEIRAWLGVATEAMLQMAEIGSGQHVLDVAAGAGDQTLDIARRIGRSGLVVATDISPSMLDLARRNAASGGISNVRTHVADAENLMLESSSFDAVVCRLGLMFLPDPLAGLREINRVLKPGGHLCSMVFAGPEANPCIRILISTALRHAGLPPRDPFQPGGLLSLGRPGAMDAHFLKAGFINVATTRLDAPFHLRRTSDYLDFVRNAASPVAQILAPLDAPSSRAAWADIESQLDAFQTEGGWTGPNALLLTAGQNPLPPSNAAGAAIPKDRS